MVGALKGNNTLFAGGEQSSFQGGLDGFKTRVTEDGFSTIVARALASPALEGESGKFACEFAF